MNGEIRARIRSRIDQLRGRGASEPAEPAPTEEPMSEPAHQPSPGDLDHDEVLSVLERVRPALQRDGGDIELVRVEDNDVYVTLVGACAGCPSATITLKLGVERILRQEFPRLGRVIQVGGPFG